MSEVRSAETSDLPGGESRRLRRRNRKALEQAHLDNCTAKEKIQERPVAKTTEVVKVIKSIGLRIDEKIKLQRAQGGCPGTIRRRRTWQAAKSYGEPQAGTDP